MKLIPEHLEAFVHDDGVERRTSSDVADAASVAMAKGGPHLRLPECQSRLLDDAAAGELYRKLSESDEPILPAIT